MFGTLRPHSCTVGTDPREAYQRAYCGLCRTLGRQAGLVGRCTLNGDAVLVALVADGLMERPAEQTPLRCPLLPIRRRPAWSADAPALEYSAAIQVLLGDQWLADRAADGARGAGFLRRLNGKRVDIALETLRRLGVATEELEDFELQQQEVEAREQVTPEEAAEPTGRALAHVFSGLSRLPDIAPEGKAAGEELAALGDAVGRAIYLIDVLEDLERDRRRGEFNPCIVGAEAGMGATAIDSERVESTIAALHAELRRVEGLVATIGLQRNLGLIRNVLCDQLPLRARRATRSARVLLTEERQDTVRRRSVASTPWLLRPAVAATVLFLAFWSWAQTVFAAVRDSAAGRLTRGVLDFLSAPFRWFQQGPGAPPEGEQPVETATSSTGMGSDGAGNNPPDGPTPQPSGGVGETATAPPTSSPQGGATPAEPPTSAGSGGIDLGGNPQTPDGGGGGIGNPCSDLGQMFRDLCCCRDMGRACGDVCGGCGDACGGCGDACGSCGDCCNGCNDCGNCCDGCGNGCNGCNNCGNGCNC